MFFSFAFDISALLSLSHGSRVVFTLRTSSLPVVVCASLGLSFLCCGCRRCPSCESCVFLYALCAYAVWHIEERTNDYCRRYRRLYTHTFSWGGGQGLVGNGGRQPQSRTERFVDDDVDDAAVRRRRRRNGGARLAGIGQRASTFGCRTSDGRLGWPGRCRLSW